MRSRFFTIGREKRVALCAVTTLITLIVPQLSIGAGDLYGDMLDLTRRELLIDAQGKTAIDMQVKRFTARVRSTKESEVKRAEVPQAFTWQSNGSLCPGKDGRPSFGTTACDDFAQRITTVARQEERVRALGRELQLIASSYEAPIVSPTYGNFPEEARAVIRIWQAGTGSALSTGTGLSLRAQPMDSSDALKQQIKGVGDALKGLVTKNDTGDEDREKFIAAVWRYIHGERFVRGVRKPEFPLPPDIPESEIGTERQYLKMRFDDTEVALDLLWQSLRASVNPVTLKRKEILWFTLSDKSRDALLPTNVVVWAYVEKMPNGQLSGDAGLQWQRALEPVLPSLCTDTGGPTDTSPDKNDCDTGDASLGAVSTRGGAFPPSPLDGTGLCTEPFQRLGYLCRPFSGTAGAAVCKQTVRPDKNNIILSACTKNTGTSATLMGPDACSDVGWADPLRFDPNTQCKVQLDCSNTAFGGGQTFEKDKNGVVHVAVSKVPRGSQAQPVYLFLHELTHAKQYCGLPVGTPYFPAGMTKAQGGAICCQNEGEAYRRQCEAYAQDGMFTDKKTGKPLTIQLDGKDIEVNTETCWQLFTDASCRDRNDFACPNTFSYSKTKTAVLNAAFNDGKSLLNLTFAQMPKAMRVSCDDAKDPKKRDPRIDAAIRDVEQTNRQVCDPNRTTNYQNTIGNNICFVDQCIEQSVENHRLIPGKMTFVANETAYPAEACIPNGPDTSTLTTVPLNVSPPIPPYRPELLVRTLDTALCQTNGEPPAYPSVICNVLADRSILLPGAQPLETLMRLVNQPLELAIAQAGITQLNEALSARIGNSLYVDYLNASIPILADITSEASTLLRTFTTIKFTDVMCPYKDDGTWLLSQNFCKPSSSSSSSKK